jgi:putative SOS response-associated peptidase YedK
LVGLAGLYSWWTNPDTGVLLATTTILTRDSAGTLTSLHDRMPLAVEHEDVQRWLDPTITGGADLIAEISRKAEKSQDQWEFYEVSPLRGDGPHLIHKLGSD